MIHVVFETEIDPDTLKQDWLRLQDCSSHRFFLSWGWIGTWLSTLPEWIHPIVMRAREASGELVGIAIFIESPRRLGLPRRLYLHQTGISDLDRIWIECNGIVSHDDYRLSVTKACLDSLYRRRPHWHIVELGGIGSCQLLETSREYFKVLIREQVPYWVVDLDGLRSKGMDYLSALSHNARKQIRRSLRHYEEYGELIVEHARTLKEALLYFDELSVLSSRRLAIKQIDSPFNIPYFNLFHRKLITERFPANEPQLIRIRAGDHVIGYSYNLLYRKRVFSYSAAYQFDDKRRLTPGHVCDVLLIREFQEMGASSYELGGGTSPHLSRIGTADGSLFWLSLHRGHTSHLAQRFNVWRRRCLSRMIP